MTDRTPTAARRLVPIGVAAYVGLLAAGYYYNLTFVQLGLVDLGTVRVGASAGEVSLLMGGFALGALAVAVATGLVLDRRGWSSDLRVKLRILVGVVASQTLLTVTAPGVASMPALAAWVAVCSVTLGVGMPVTFSMMSDLVPVRHRGAAAGAVTGLAFFVAALYPREWRIEDFAPVMTAIMVPGLVVLAVLAFGRWSLIDELAAQDLGPGRFCRPTPLPTGGGVFWLLVGLLFAAFFIDSLGFLRIIDTPAYIEASWQSPELGVRAFIAVSHLVGAAMAAVLYTAFGLRWLGVWVLGLFAFTHLLYTFHLATSVSGIEPPLTLPLFYVLAVSFYTTLNFALWPDLSTARNVGIHTGLGVGVAGWLASFASTALALASREVGLTLATHLRYVNALALLLAVAYPLAWYLRRMRALARAGSTA